MSRRSGSSMSFANGGKGRPSQPRRWANMDLQSEHPAEENKRLRRCINDLASVLALPALWSGREASDIARTLLDVLPGMLRLDLLYVRLEVPAGEAPVEMVWAAKPRSL